MKEIQPLINQHINNFHVIELMGHGAMASVYRAFDADLERDVALKIPNPRCAERENFAARFNREAKAMARLHHRNIVQIYGVGEYDGVPFLVMEYVGGVSLSQILAEKGRMEVEEAVEYILQVCEAVGCAHRRGIVHRDLKPSNILVETSSRVLVADFGISKIISGNTNEDTLTFVGTPIYMSPEQCGEGVLDQRTDIYSLGVIFYEMVVGRPPFDGNTPAEIIKSHLMETPRIPSDQEVKLPPKIVKIVRKMLAKNPERRYLDAQDLIFDLEQWKKDAQARPLSYPQTPITGEKAPLVLCYVSQKVLYSAVVSALKNIEHQMITVSSFTELMAKLSTSNARMVIINHESGKTGVFELAEKIRRKRKKSELQLILLTHGISREEVEAAFHSGIDDIIAEPFDPSILVSKLEGMLVGEQRSIESRRFFRKPISGKITVSIDSTILDISEGGMRLSTNMALKIGEIVRFDLQLFRELGFGEKVGKVVWISKNDSDDRFAFQTGIDFVDITKAERDRLRKWIFTAETAGRGHNSPFRRKPGMGPFLVNQME